MNVIVSVSRVVSRFEPATILNKYHLKFLTKFVNVNNMDKSRKIHDPKNCRFLKLPDGLYECRREDYFHCPYVRVSDRVLYCVCPATTNKISKVSAPAGCGFLH